MGLTPGTGVTGLRRIKGVVGLPPGAAGEAMASSTAIAAPLAMIKGFQNERGRRRSGNARETLCKTNAERACEGNIESDPLQKYDTRMQTFVHASVKYACRSVLRLRVCALRTTTNFGLPRQPDVKE